MIQPAVVPANRFSLADGARVLDRYTIRRGLGIGGFGEVYFAVSDAGKEVAVKRVQRNLEIELRGVSHCLNLKHPNLVSLFDICRDDAGQCWIVMEHVAGPSLRDVLDAAPNGLDEAEVRRWFQGAASGVAHLHREGLVHRDLKPGNLFDDYGIVKVGDYGLSKYISESRRGGQTESVGTFHYMAPEIGRGVYGREIDIYALGVILYEMLTGRLPFDGETSHEIIIKHLTSDPDLSGIAEPFKGVIEKALRKDPLLRWSSVAEMLSAIDSPAASGSQTDHRPPADEPIRAQFVNPPVQQSPAADSADSIPPEPFAQAVRTAWQNLGTSLKQMQMSPAVRVVFTIVMVLVLLRNLRWLLPLLTLIGLVYVPYYVIRQLVLSSRRPQRSGPAANSAVLVGSPTPTASVIPAAAVAPMRPMPVGAAAAGGRPPKRLKLSRSQLRDIRRGELAGKRASSRLAELAGSWVAAAVAVTCCGIAAAVIGLRGREITPLDVIPFVWVTVIAAAIAGVVVAMGKLWEGGSGDPLHRRFALLGCGGLLGAVAYRSLEYLMVPAESGLQRSLTTELPTTLYLADGTPSIAAFMAHFALLLGLIRWWRLTDPLRSRRLSLWNIAVVVVAEWALHQILPIPQPWGMLAAGTAAAGVQIAAAWEPPETWLRRPVYEGMRV